MCAVFERKGQGFRPGRRVHAVGPQGVVDSVWAGFARNEILEWWRRKGGVLIDIPADRFAERSNFTGKLIWANVPSGLVIRGLIDSQSGEPLIKVVTRSASEDEQARFQHPRMPLLAGALFPGIPVPDMPGEDGFLF
jgi:hypothetical protein